MRAEEAEVYCEWINALKDRVSRARVQVRVDWRVHGNPASTAILPMAYPS